MNLNGNLTSPEFKQFIASGSIVSAVAVEIYTIAVGDVYLLTVGGENEANASTSNGVNQYFISYLYDDFEGGNDLVIIRKVFDDSGFTNKPVVSNTLGAISLSYSKASAGVPLNWSLMQLV